MSNCPSQETTGNGQDGAEGESCLSSKDEVQDNHMCEETTYIRRTRRRRYRDRQKCYIFNLCSGKSAPSVLAKKVVLNIRA